MSSVYKTIQIWNEIKMETYYNFLSICLFCSIILIQFKYSFQIIRGIPPERIEFYAPSKDFLCLDGTLTIPYSYINDDYCDCLDASDEPGTSACLNGTFYCINTGHLPLSIPSSRVNDGICDCCDGSDEWENNVKKNTCQNTCGKLNHIAKKEAIRVDNLYSLGFKIREQLIIKGKQLLLQKQNAIIKLLSIKKEALLIKKKLFIDKEIAKAKENKAEEKEVLKEQNEAIKIFNEIDINKNNKVEVDEIISYCNFDQNNNGIVSQDKIDHFMMNKKELDFKDFISSDWNHVKLLIYSKYVSEKYPIKMDIIKKYQNQENSHYNINNDLRQYNDNTNESIKFNKLLYSEETKIIVNESRKILSLYEEADRKVKNIENTIYHLKNSLRKDFGPDYEFIALDGQCYEYADHEYLYQLCLFDKATQRSIKGGPEINLGIWKNWTNFISNEPKYHTMLYDNGHACYNSHKRFTRVHLNCGLKPRLVLVTEPNRCEYSMEFEVPSVCVIQDAKYSREKHEREEL